MPDILTKVYLKPTISTETGRPDFDLVAPDGSKVVWSDLDGKTFQVHGPRPDEGPGPERCLTMASGEQCGLMVGHEGKHIWAGGD